VLAGLARETTRIHLGALVSPVTFRLPGNMAKIAITVDEMSGGRVELGLGTGWNDDEHRQYGFPFPPIEDRAEMLEEQLEVVHGLFHGEDGWSFRGRHYTIEGALFRTKPPAGRPRIIVGGRGTPRSTRIAARFADEFNITSTEPEKIREVYGWLDDACRAIGRDPATIDRSAMIGVLIGADQREVDRRASDLMRMVGRGDGSDRSWFEERRPRWIAGAPGQAREAVDRYAAAGVERIMLQSMIPRDLDMIDLAAAELVAGAQAQAPPIRPMRRSGP
jgi:alkanesulfonate monooxygenase SsuD/methylene tetrahydromethanopterin reductase-like flavin-dependent oxidoreductase (luciferase family)